MTVYLSVLVCRQDVRHISNTVGLNVQIHRVTYFFNLLTSLDWVNRQPGLDMTGLKDISD